MLEQACGYHFTTDHGLHIFQKLHGTKYSRIDEVKFVEDSL